MSWDRLKRVTAPSAVPLTVPTLRSWVRQDLAEDDVLLAELIQDATDFLEGPNGIGLAFLSQQWEYHLDAFPEVICIPLGPVISVDSITYIDSAGTEQTVAAADYKVDTVRNPARIEPAFGQAWPTPREEINAVKVTFTAGHSNLPGDVKRAIAMLVAHWYQHREAVIVGDSAAEVPMAVQTIIDKYRVGRFA